MTLKETFKSAERPLLNIYFTAGYPQLNSLPLILNTLEESGVDMVEIGIPYSDPLSDGPVIQNSSSVALNNGITIDRIFSQLADNPTSVPKIMMGYFNCVLQYGIESFCQKCQETGVEGLILPDLPIEIYLEKYQSIVEKYKLSNIFLVTPQTSEERIRFIDENSASFIYAVSSASTTGKKAGIQDSESYLKRLQDMELKSPLMIGFNISTCDDLELAGKYAHGGIVGSAFIRSITEAEHLETTTKEFIHSLTQKTTA